MKEKSLSEKINHPLPEFENQFQHRVTGWVYADDVREAVLLMIRDIEVLSMSNDEVVCGTCIDIIKRRAGELLSK